MAWLAPADTTVHCWQGASWTDLFLVRMSGNIG